MPYFENGIYHVFYLDDERPPSDQFHPGIWFKLLMHLPMFIGKAIPCGESYEQDIAIGTGSVIKKTSNILILHGAQMEP